MIFTEVPQMSMVLWIAAAVVVLGLVLRGVLRARRKRPAREDVIGAAPASNDFAAIARIVMEGVGGKGNITTVDNCITRLRLEIKDYTLVDEKKIKSAGIAGIIRPSKTAVQVIVGTRVQQVAEEFKKLM